MKAPLCGQPSEGFLWLDLNDEFLKQWENFCLRRRIQWNHEDEPCNGSSGKYCKEEAKLLSTYKLKSQYDHHYFHAVLKALARSNISS